MPNEPAVEPPANAEKFEELLALGRYVVWRKIASGSQADTLEAVDRKSGRPVAIKRFSVGHAKSWKEVELAEREIRVLSSLSHPSLPAYLDHFEENGQLYLVMELVEGQNLASLNREGKRLGLDQLLSLVRALEETLEYLHSRVPPVIHRDIKPANIILRPDGSFSLVDFGSVRDGLKPEGGSTVVGTFGYMAPEQFQGRALPASDIYAVGALLLALLSGRGPEQLPHRGLAIDVAAALNGVAPPNWVTAISQMVSIDPESRPSSLRPVLALLDGNKDSVRDEQESPVGEAEPEVTYPTGTEPDSSFTVMVGSGRGMLPWVFLAVARIAMWVALGVVIPTVLFALAVFFGQGLRTAAYRVTAANRLVQARLATIAGHLQRAEPFVLQGRHYRRARHRGHGWRYHPGSGSWEGQRSRDRAHVDSAGFHRDSWPVDEPGTAERLRANAHRGGSQFPETEGEQRDGNPKRRKNQN